MTTEEAIGFIEKHGVVLVAGKGPAPRLTEAIVGGPVKGSWWGHPQGQQIFRVLQDLADSDAILFCRLVEGKVTLVHRRLWPALVRVSSLLPKERIAQVRQEHTAEGKHINREVPFPQWVPKQVELRSQELSEEEALTALGVAVTAEKKKSTRKRISRHRE
jgi:hypothetical protein